MVGRMKKSAILIIGIGFILFIIGATVGENKGTMDSFMFWPIVGWFGLGIIYLFLQKYIVKAFSG